MGKAAKTKSVICPRCQLQFDDEYDIDSICTNAAEAAECTWAPHNRAKMKPVKLVGPDFDATPPSYVISATQSLINDGSAWHPNIDQDGSIGRSANDFIARKLCRPPRSAAGKRARHMFDEAQRFGIDMKAPLSPRMQAIKDMCLPNGSRVDGIDPPEVPGPGPFKVVDLDNLTTEDIED
jgi:hypothetical protein